MHDLIRDFRFAVRGLLRMPGLTSSPGETQALGDWRQHRDLHRRRPHQLLRPYERSERLKAVFEHDVRRAARPASVAPCLVPVAGRRRAWPLLVYTRPEAPGVDLLAPSTKSRDGATQDRLDRVSRYRAQLRGLDLVEIERILRFSEERYMDTAPGRFVVVGRHQSMLVMIPYETDDESVTPVTIHTTTRQQINIRIQTERFRHA